MKVGEVTMNTTLQEFVNNKAHHPLKLSGTKCMTVRADFWSFYSREFHAQTTKY